MKKYTIIDAFLARFYDFPLYMIMCYFMIPYTGKWVSFYFFITYVIISVIRGESYCNAENIKELHREIERLKRELKQYEDQRLEA